MSAVVVDHQVQVEVSRELAVQAAQEAQKLLVSMTWVALSDDLALQQFHRGEQSGRAIAFVVVGHGAAAPLFQRQARLGAVQRLNLALLIHAQHQRVIGWIQIQADDVGEFFHKLRVARQLEAS